MEPVSEEVSFVAVENSMGDPSILNLVSPLLAHADEISVLEDPIGLALIAIFYALPGVIAVVALNARMSYIPFSLRAAAAAVGPFFLWYFIFYLSGLNSSSFLEGLANLWQAFLERELSIVLLPGVTLVIAAAFWDRHRISLRDRAARYTETT